MKIHQVRNEESMKENTRVALLEQAITHINQSLIRIEKRFDSVDARFDKVDSKLDRLDSKIDSTLKWMLGVYFAGFGALFGMIAHLQHWI